MTVRQVLSQNAKNELYTCGVLLWHYHKGRAKKGRERLDSKEVEIDTDVWHSGGVHRLNITCERKKMRLVTQEGGINFRQMPRQGQVACWFWSLRACMSVEEIQCHDSRVTRLARL